MKNPAIHFGNRSFTVDSIKWQSADNCAFVKFTDDKGNQFETYALAPDRNVVIEQILSDCMKGRLEA